MRKSEYEYVCTLLTLSCLAYKYRNNATLVPKIKQSSSSLWFLSSDLLSTQKITHNNDNIHSLVVTLIFLFDCFNLCCRNFYEMDAYTLHLAMAALVGASVVAVSAYYMHRKTLTQLLEFAKSVERERDDNSDAAESPHHVKRHGCAAARRCSSRRKGSGYYRRCSASLPDVTAISGHAVDGEERRNGPLHVDGIPAGLPRLHTLPEGMDLTNFSPE